MYVDGSPVVRVANPVNMQWVPGQEGVEDGQLRPAEGITAFTTGVGADRGALVWDGVHYRVSGTKLITVSSAGVVAQLGDITGTDLARMANSFDLLAIAADDTLYYWNGSVLTTVTDPNIGDVEDMIWVDGYFMCTDGEFIVVTELTNPSAVNPTKYSGTDRPDPIVSLQLVQGEPHVISRHYIDVFKNVGGAGFPFERAQSGVITKGAVGKRAACEFQDTVAFVGGGFNEAVSVYLARNAQTIPIASREIDNLLLEYTEAELATIHLESVVDRGSRFLYMHLPDRTEVYDATASAAAQQPVWSTRVSTIDGAAKYKAINITRFGDQWVVGDPSSSAIGVWSTTDSRHYGENVRWEFHTPMLRNGGKGAIIDRLELVALPGVVPTPTFWTSVPMVATSYSTDGVNWSENRRVRSGLPGNRNQRIVWFGQGMINNYRIQRFTGDSTSRLTVMKLEAQIRPLAF